MINKKTMILFGIGLAIITLVLVGKMVFESNQGSKTEYISENEYQSYSKFEILGSKNI